MSAATRATTPAQRANIAAAMIRKGTTNACGGRAFDGCFEMGDGAQVVAYLVAKAVTDPRIADACRRNDWGVWSNGSHYDPATTPP